MLSVPTLWTAFIVNFVALGLIWAYVVRSYSNLEAARFWAAAAFAAAAGAILGMGSRVFESMFLLIAAASLTVFASCLAAMGIMRFYDRPVSWRATALFTGLIVAGISFFIVGYDST